MANVLVAGAIVLLVALCFFLANRADKWRRQALTYQLELDDEICRRIDAQRTLDEVRAYWIERYKEAVNLRSAIEQHRDELAKKYDDLRSRILILESSRLYSQQQEQQAFQMAPWISPHPLRDDCIREVGQELLTELQKHIQMDVDAKPHVYGCTTVRGRIMILKPKEEPK